MFWALKSAQSRCLGHKWSVKPAAGIVAVTAQAFFLEEAAESGAACGEMSLQRNRFCQAVAEKPIQRDAEPMNKMTCAQYWAGRSMSNNS